MMRSAARRQPRSSITACPVSSRTSARTPIAANPARDPSSGKSMSRSARSAISGGRRMRHASGRLKSVMSQIARCDSRWNRR